MTTPEPSRQETGWHRHQTQGVVRDSDCKCSHGIRNVPAADVTTLTDPFVAISTLLDAMRPDLVGTELQMWRRVTKVCEESGEVWRALSGYVAENPRKGQTHTLEDLRGELLDTASAALCAWAHLNNNEGDPVAALLAHVAGTVERLNVALRWTR